MNKLESFVYNKVKSNYLLKNFIRNIYQGLYDLLPRYKSFFINEPLVREDYFFGFHDTNPFSDKNEKILCNRLTIGLRMPEKDDILEVGYLCGTDFSTWEKLGETKAWNYHKGCRLQWYNNDNIIFNVIEKNRLKSQILNINNKDGKLLDWPIDTISHDAKYATSFSYSRLQRNMPGYGYAWDDDDSYLEEKHPSLTGLFIINTHNNERKLLVSLQQLTDFQHEDGMDDTHHFVTHTEFSYDDRYVSFLHRWYKGTYRKTRLIVYDRNTGNMYSSPTNGMVSHYVWNKKNGIVAYCRIEGIDSHVYFDGPEMMSWKRCGYPKLNSDGHHHFITNDKFVVDTYPDKRRHAKLYTVDIENDTVTLIADVESPKKYVSPDEHHHWKCDLHPRCSSDGQLVSFDSVHTGKRAICVMRL